VQALLNPHSSNEAAVKKVSQFRLQSYRRRGLPGRYDMQR
jgi:hypothetical protein